MSKLGIDWYTPKPHEASPFFSLGADITACSYI